MELDAEYPFGGWVEIALQTGVSKALQAACPDEIMTLQVTMYS